MKRNVTILVVDDDSSLRTTLADILRIKGYDPIIAGTGAEALNAAEKYGIGLALIDLRLPDISGLEVMEQLKQRLPLSEAIILTGNASMDTAIEATRKGAFSYLVKPYQVDDLLLTIRHGIERHQAQEEILRLASHPRLNPNPVIEITPKGQVTYFNPAAAKLFPNLDTLGVGHPVLTGIETLFSSVFPAEDVVCEVETGSATYERHSSFVRESDLIRVHILDISERKRAEAAARANMEELTRKNRELSELYDKLKQAQSQLFQSEKMASIGVLAAGVAHEINNPVGYISANLGTLEEYVKDFLSLLSAYESLEKLVPAESADLCELQKLKQRLDLDYVAGDVTNLLHESQEGIERVKSIVKNLKDFSHVSTDEKWKLDDIHRGLESALTMVWNELKYKCEVKKEYGTLPPVECLLPELNQVFMNLLVNAGQAIDSKGTVTIRTDTDGNQVWIEVSDTGKGIAPEHLSRIFEPFFTTKPVGKGTGLGLSVSYSIVQRHHGEIMVRSKPGEGTTFRVNLPVKQPAIEEATDAA